MRAPFIVHTRDPDEFVERLEPVAKPDRVRALRTSFGATLHACPLPHTGFLRLRIDGGRVRFTEPSVYGLTVPLWTSIDASGHKVAPGEAFVSAPMKETVFDVPGRHAVLAINFDGAWLDSEAGGQLVRPNGRISLQSGEGAALLRSTMAAAHQIASDVDPRGLAEIEADLLDRFLLACPAPEQRSQPESIQQAQEFLRAHLKRPTSATRVAREVGVPLRTLYDAFRRQFGCGPIGWLRERRLEAAQRELLALTPEETSVTEIATRYGFFHFGRFAEQYRHCFGVTPSGTLRI